MTRRSSNGEDVNLVARIGVGGDVEGVYRLGRRSVSATWRGV